MGIMACCLFPLLFLCGFMTGPILAHPVKSLSQFPFFTVWNAPTENCGSRYGIDLDLSVFSIVHNQNQTFVGNNITIFYADKLGFYPHYTQQNESVNGGVPQNSSLNDHLQQAETDLVTKIPDEGFSGLAVVDWEGWRPLWERNWGNKNIYRQGSRALVKAKHPDWNTQQIEIQSIKDFGSASRAFMEQTLKLAQEKRSGGLWGFYGFPDCYNYKDKNTTYTGECPTQELKWNDKLNWLWNVSTALYPNIYLDLSFKGHSREILLYAQHRIMEGMRVRKQVTPIQPVVIPYARIVYTYSLEFLSQEELVHTIGESVALGAAGIVLWGDASFSANKSACQLLKDYIDATLGRYIVNVTEAASICSVALCSSHGRCVRREPSSLAYLHLDPAIWTIIPRSVLLPSARSPSYLTQMKVGGKNKRTTNNFTEQFKCQCFPGWEGQQCQKWVSQKL